MNGPYYLFCNINIQVTRSRVSKWDKPKETPPAPVNREVTDEDIHAAELPAAGTSRNIAARYGHTSLFLLARLESVCPLIWEGAEDLGHGVFGKMIGWN